MDRRIYHITKRLPESLGGAWTVENMAAEVQMSASHFQRLFKEVTGITPMAYLNDLRLERARSLLADSCCFLQIKEIGFRVGLTNDSHFTRCFRAKFGLSPTEFRTHGAEIAQAVLLYEKE